VAAGIGCEATRDVVVLDPTWLCNRVLGHVMAPDNFPVTLRMEQRHGMVTREVFGQVVEFRDQDADRLLQVLCGLQLCFEVAPSALSRPSLLDATAPSPSVGTCRTHAHAVSEQVRSTSSPDVSRA
jgi:hypothetical protein